MRYLEMFLKIMKTNANDQLRIRHLREILHRLETENQALQMKLDKQTKRMLS